MNLKICNVPKGPFKSYVDKILTIFDYLPTSTWTFFTLNVDKKKHFLTTYPPHLVQQPPIDIQAVSYNGARTVHNIKSESLILRPIYYTALYKLQHSFFTKNDDLHFASTAIEFRVC